MTELTIDDKKYVLITEENFRELQKKAALKSKPEKTFSVAEARVYSKTRINEWATEK